MDANAWNDKINDLIERLRPAHGGGSLGKLMLLQEQPGRMFDLIGMLRDALRHYDGGELSALDVTRVVDGLLHAYTDHRYVLPFDTAGNAAQEAKADDARTSKAWKLVAWETVGTQVFGDEEEVFVGYDNIQTGHTLLTGEALERYEGDGAPFDDGETFRSVKVVADGDDVDAFVAAINKGHALPARAATKEANPAEYLTPGYNDRGESVQFLRDGSTLRPGTERQRQEQIARSTRLGNGQIFRHVFECEDGQRFEALAITESAALRVLNAERPGMRAEYLGAVGIGEFVK